MKWNKERRKERRVEGWMKGIKDACKGKNEGRHLYLSRCSSLVLWTEIWTAWSCLTPDLVWEELLWVDLIPEGHLNWSAKKRMWGGGHRGSLSLKTFSRTYFLICTWHHTLKLSYQSMKRIYTYTFVHIVYILIHIISKQKWFCVLGAN